ncbi:ABC transporter permease [Pectinatus haikarae]|uniref:ABC transport system permease protein n=1 Tax=Pectinatus haikarae TaxID=349096 RepID=A0ABT9Y947_9FIRM|nr:ABC transporter permease [Pectinatus haikarae]MDQ0204015.1 putative ABC transport system permease protein [Pectinatus haikarae]
MFWQMVKGAVVRQSRRLLLVALTVALGVSLATAMLNVMFDVGDKVNQELKAYGANIVVTPKNASVLKDVYGLDDTGAHKEYLNESDLGKIKTIFWTNNIVAFAPQLSASINLQNGQTVNLDGTWFDRQMLLPTGEYFSTGEKYLKSWWQVDGDWAADDGSNGVMVGKKLANDLKVNKGDTISYKKPDGQADTLRVSGIVSGGGSEENAILAPLALVQKITGLTDKIDQVEVSAVTTPENELARKAAANPKSLTMKEYEIWYCTSYVSSIAYQIEEVIPDSVAHPVRQIAESEGKILDKTQMLMLLITGLSLLSSVLGVSNLVSANIMERSRELGLLKALGASNLAIVLLILTEIFLAGLAGGICGYFIGLGFAQIIGNTVFNSSIAVNIVVMPIVAGLMSLVILLGSLPAIRMILSLRPAIVLHGR